MTESENLRLLINISIEANSVDPDQTAPTGAVWSGSTLFAEELQKHFSKQQKQMIFEYFGALSVNKCEFQFLLCNARDFHESHALLSGSTKLLTLI